MYKLLLLRSIMSSKSFLSYFKKPVNSVNSSDVNDVNNKEGSCVNNSSSACNIDFVPKQPYHPQKISPFQRRNSGVVTVPVSTTGLTHTHGCIMA